MASGLVKLLLVSAVVSLAVAPGVGANELKTGGVSLPASRGPPRFDDETCVEVEIGGERALSLDCLNRRLQRQVERVRPVGDVPPLDASAPALQVHGFNESALRQQFGRNFGTSVVPFRPSPPVFAPPFGAHGR